jgi:predicted RNA binding protein YcfA (HicA-like mRNA interferase family)
MLFTDVSTQRAVRALSKEGFRVVREGKHVILTDGRRLLTVPPREAAKSLYASKYPPERRYRGRPFPAASGLASISTVP